MGQDVKSALYFDDYIVDSISFKNNPKCNEEETFIDFTVDPQTTVGEDKKSMVVKLTVHIFKDAVKNNYPFEMSVTVEGFYRLEMQDEDILKYERNAIAILYPYIRAIVSNFTATANVNPLILPAINVNKLIEVQNMEEKERCSK